jgi:hypothetical protein
VPLLRLAGMPSCDGIGRGPFGNTSVLKRILVAANPRTKCLSDPERGGVVREIHGEV